MRRPQHRFHLVTSSPWPFFSAIAALNLILSAIAYMHDYRSNLLINLAGFSSPFFILIWWWRDVIREATFQGKHTTKVQLNLRFGFALFIFSEVMFFFGFFWAFFHSSLSPAIEIGAVWPPANIVAPYTWGIPLFNTAILLISGIGITYTHQYLILGLRGPVIEGFIGTLICAVVFLSAQLYEFIEAVFDISDSIYGATFYMLSGFHGAHVIVGTLFIGVCYARFNRGHFTIDHHVGFEAAVWYWHFVDVVWLFLYLFVYYWGGTTEVDFSEVKWDEFYILKVGPAPYPFER